MNGGWEGCKGSVNEGRRVADWSVLDTMYLVVSSDYNSMVVSASSGMQDALHLLETASMRLGSASSSSQTQAEAMIDAIKAPVMYAANAKVLRTVDETVGTLLDGRA